MHTEHALIMRRKDLPGKYLVVCLLILTIIFQDVDTLPICSPISGILAVQNSCRLPSNPGGYSFSSLTINSPVLLESSGSVSSNRIHVQGKLTIGSQGGIILQGSKAAGGSSDGVSLSGAGSGGSHAGRGGSPKSTRLSLGQATVSGDPVTPVTPGGRGGDGSAASSGGLGGSALKITSSQCQIDGIIQSNGYDAVVSKNGGGGSGGSILIQCQQLSGDAILEAIGGRGDGDGGGGSGGRISVEYQSGSFNGQQRIYAHGGKTGKFCRT